MYIIVLAEPVLLQQLAEKIYPPIRNACLFNRSQPILTRGIDFFKNNKCKTSLIQTTRSQISKKRPNSKTQVVNTFYSVWSVCTCQQNGSPKTRLLKILRFTSLLTKCSSNKEWIFLIRMISLSLPNRGSRTLSNSWNYVKSKSQRLKYVAKKNTLIVAKTGLMQST